MTEKLTNHESFTSSLGYNEKEQAKINAEAKRLRGLRVTYYSDPEAKNTVRGGVVSELCESFDADCGICAAKYEGYICFETDGAHTSRLEGAPDATFNLFRGELHPEPANGVEVNVKAGTYYGVTIVVTWEAGKDFSFKLTCDGKEDRFTITVGRPLLAHGKLEITPFLGIPMRDCQIMMGPDDYFYMTGTSGPDFWNNTYNIHVYRSKDLVDWDDLGVAWDFERDATWAKKVTKDTRIPLWAPEISYIKGDWYLTYSLGFNDGFCGGILKSISGKPEGPYTDTTEGLLVHDIDLSLFCEDDGKVYLLFSDGKMALMKDDMSGFAGPVEHIYSTDGLPVGFEGGYILKHEGKYYLTAATYNHDYDENGNIQVSYDSMIGVSDSLMGPYSQSRLLLYHGGHNNLFVDREGNIVTTLFAPTGNYGFSCKPAMVRLKADERGILTPVED